MRIKLKAYNYLKKVNKPIQAFSKWLSTILSYLLQQVLALIRKKGRVSSANIEQAEKKVEKLTTTLGHMLRRFCLQQIMTQLLCSGHIKSCYYLLKDTYFLASFFRSPNFQNFVGILFSIFQFQIICVYLVSQSSQLRQWFSQKNIFLSKLNGLQNGDMETKWRQNSQI